MELRRLFSFDKPLIVVTVILLLIGIVMVFSSSVVLAGEKYNRPFHFLIQQILGAGFGLFMIFLIVRIKKPIFQNPFFVYGLLIFSALLLMLCFVMPPIANTNRWIQFAGIRFQPSELAKISLVLFFAYYCDRNKHRINEIKTLLLPLGILGFFVLLILKEPNFSTALFIAGLSAMMLFLGGVKMRYFGILGAAFAVLFAFYLFSADYRMERISGFLSPEKDPLGKSFQVTQSKLAVGSGGLFGESIGQSKQKLFFLPFAHTDFIFAILGEETGLVGTLITLSLFVLFLWRGLGIAFRTANPVDKMIAAGLTLAIATQAFLNISVVLGMGPATGVTLPFVSYGRSSLVCNLAAVGIILNISQKRFDLGVRP